MSVPTSIQQRFRLLFFAIITTLVVLEIMLRLGGMMFNAVQHARNKANFNAQEYRILCIGESTTALGGNYSYPSQLEAILNQSQTSRVFKIINRGLVSKTSADILRELKGNLNEYQPHLVVAMIGVNDPKLEGAMDLFIFDVDNFLQHARVYKLFKLLAWHLKHRVQGTKSLLVANYHRSKEHNNLKSALKQLYATSSAYDNLKAQVENTPPGPKRVQMLERLDQFNMRRMMILLWIANTYKAQKDFSQGENLSG